MNYLVTLCRYDTGQQAFHTIHIERGEQGSQNAIAENLARMRSEIEESFWDVRSVDYVSDVYPIEAR